MDSINQDLIPALSRITGIEFPLTNSKEDVLSKLTYFINDLINHDFSQLVALLYRVDVPEKKLRQVLDATAGENAAAIIANMIMERQLEKIQSREKYKSNNSSISDEEKW